MLLCLGKIWMVPYELICVRGYLILKIRVSYKSHCSILSCNSVRAIARNLGLIYFTQKRVWKFDNGG